MAFGSHCWLHGRRVISTGLLSVIEHKLRSSRFGLIRRSYHIRVVGIRHGMMMSGCRGRCASTCLRPSLPRVLDPHPGSHFVVQVERNAPMTTEGCALHAFVDGPCSEPTNGWTFGAIRTWTCGRGDLIPTGMNTMLSLFLIISSSHGSTAPQSKTTTQCPLIPTRPSTPVRSGCETSTPRSLFLIISSSHGSTSAYHPPPSPRRPPNALFFLLVLQPCLLHACLLWLPHLMAPWLLR
jgi:hypothetical protein